MPKDYTRQISGVPAEEIERFDNYLAEEYEKSFQFKPPFRHRADCVPEKLSFVYVSYFSVFTESDESGIFSRFYTERDCEFKRACKA